MNLQEQLDAGDGHLVLRPGEYRGPLIISRPGTVIEGSGATVWADHGPVIRVRARGVQIRNLRAEIMTDSTDDDARTAVHTLAPDTVLENMEVYGDIVGPIEGAGKCSIPRTADFGTFASEKENTFVIHVDVPGQTKVHSCVHGLLVSPQIVGPGPADIIVTAEPMHDGTNLYGEILLDSPVRRRIYVRGHAENGARHVDAGADLTILRKNGHARQQEVLPPAEPRKARAGSAASSSVRSERSDAAVLQRGQRISLKEYEDRPLRIQLDTAAPAEIDAFIFALAHNEHVRSDADFVFYGHPCLDHTNAARTGSDGRSPYAEFVLSNAPAAIQRFVIAFSVDTGIFAPIDAFHNAEVAVREGGSSIYTFDAACATHDQTIVAAELYRYKGVWKLSCADRGLPGGISTLCSAYGVELA